MKHLNLLSLDGFFHYFRLSYHYAGRKLFVFLMLNFFGVFFESFGMLLFIPFLRELNVGSDVSPNRISQFINGVFHLLGLEISIGSILLLMVAAICAKGLAVFLIGAYRSNLIYGISREMRDDLVKSYTELEYLSAVSRSSGTFIQLLSVEITRAINAIDNFCRILTTIITVSVLVGAAILLQPQMSVLILLAGLAHMAVLKVAVRYTKELSQQESVHGAALSDSVNSIFGSFKYLKSTSRFSGLIRRISRANHAYVRSQTGVGIAQALAGAIREPIQVIFLAGIIYYHVVILGENVAPILVSLLLFQRCLGEMAFFHGLWQAVSDFGAGLENLYENGRALKNYREAADIGVLPEFKRSIRLDDVSFSYGEGEVLKGVSLEIPLRSSVAFVGRSGNGKTTLVDLITGLLKPQSGAVYVDDVSLNSINLIEYRRRIGYVSQDTVIFSDTVAGNITMELDTVPDDLTLLRIRQAARLARVDEFVDQMPDGYMHKVGEGGTPLSGGQRQRLAIARELYRRPELLILDESTSSLDSVTEDFIQNCIRDLRGAVTIIIISHRLSTVKDADKIFVIDHGTIAESGTLRELAGNSTGIFKQIYEIQKFAAAE